MDRFRLILVALILIVAISMPVIGYSIYPKESLGADIEGGRATDIAPFISTIEDSKYYIGLKSFNGEIIGITSHGFVLKSDSNESIMVMLPGCIIVNNKPQMSRYFIQGLLGKHVTVKGYLFSTPHRTIVKPIEILVNGQKIMPGHCKYNDNHSWGSDNQYNWEDNKEKWMDRSP